MNFIKDTNAVMASGSIKQPIQEAITYTGYTSTGSSFAISGDVELESKPAWAIYTN